MRVADDPRMIRIVEKIAGVVRGIGPSGARASIGQRRLACS
jgi:hypothetical protein